MSLPQLSQLLLAFFILLSTAGNFIALSPPHPRKPLPSNARSTQSSSPQQPDLFQTLHMTHRSSTFFYYGPVAVLLLIHTLFVLSYPSPPPLFGLAQCPTPPSPTLITPTLSTVLPLALTLLVGIPLRLASYGTLGKDFTFDLREPSRLITSGMYAWVQHPSYVGLVALGVGNNLFLGREDGVLGCWVGDSGVLRAVRLGLLVAVVYVMGTRVRQEEKMLRGRFGREWEEWHRGTPRFVPFVKWL